MQINSQTIPLVTKYLQFIFFLSVIMFLGKALFIPLFFGLLLSIIMYPVCKWLELHGVHKAIAISICLLIVSVIFLGLLWLLAWQFSVFRKDAPIIFGRIETAGQQIQIWIKVNTRLATTNWADKLMESIGSILTSTVQTTLSTLVVLFLTPIYTALIMYHRKVFVHFLKLITPARYQLQLDSILQQIIHTYFNYIKGMVLVYIIVGILNSIGLLVLGVKHAILFGVLCSIMTIIPYVGLFISALLPITIVWMETGNILYPLGVIAIFSIVQYLEAYLIFPKVVGRQLQLSTLAMLVAIIAGGIIWGVSGMILFIPFVSILKIVTDNIEEWKPLNLLLSR